VRPTSRAADFHRAALQRCIHRMTWVCTWDGRQGLGAPATLRFGQSVNTDVHTRCTVPVTVHLLVVLLFLCIGVPTADRHDCCRLDSRPSTHRRSQSKRKGGSYLLCDTNNGNVGVIINEGAHLGKCRYTGCCRPVSNIIARQWFVAVFMLKVQSLSESS
jgi:hypothetical protein